MAYPLSYGYSTLSCIAKPLFSEEDKGEGKDRESREVAPHYPLKESKISLSDLVKRIPITGFSCLYLI